MANAPRTESWAAMREALERILTLTMDPRDKRDDASILTEINVVAYAVLHMEKS